MDATCTLLNSKVPVDIIDEGPIHMLNIDTLLIIFNYLSLYDKLMIMRVSKKWHHIIKNHAWSVIDFRDKGPIRKVTDSESRYRQFKSINGQNRGPGKEWQFPKNEKDVLKFLAFYAGTGLQEVYLTLVNDGIMSYLRVNCPYIHTLGLIVDKTMPEQEYHKYYGRLPRKLQRLDLNLNGIGFHDFKLIIPWLEKSSHLRQVIISDFNLCFATMSKLLELTGLRGYGEIHVDVFYEFNEPKTADKILTSTVGSLTSLTCFKLTILCCYQKAFAHFISKRRIDIDHLLRSIAQWTHLKVLLRDVSQYRHPVL
ncbi:uncharacterized protein [Amphiura filiformis]|uniref:uncharacterized protein n=1 Tax=Amphiura filiformis TaxID=82378 RepID=UPI003B213EF5